MNAIPVGQEGRPAGAICIRLVTQYEAETERRLPWSVALRALASDGFGQSVGTHS